MMSDGVDVIVGEVVVAGPGESVQGALHIGEERVAAEARTQTDRAAIVEMAKESVVVLEGLDGLGHSVEADRDGLEQHVTRGLGLAGLVAVAYQAVPDCLPFWNGVKVKVKAMSACESPLVSMLMR